MANRSYTKGILIIGPPRSGTTLLAGLIAQHPHAGVTMEGLGHDARHIMGVKIWANKLCVPNQITLHPVQDQRSLHRRLEDGLRAVLGRPRLRGRAREHDPPYYTPPEHRQTTIQTYVEKWDADILAIVRNPDQSVDSMQKRGYQSFNQARHRWAKAMHIMQEIQNRWPERVCYVTFENLILKSRQTLKKCCDFMGIEFNPCMLKGYSNTPQYKNEHIDSSKVKKEAPDCQMNKYDSEAFSFYESLR